MTTVLCTPLLFAVPFVSAKAAGKDGIRRQTASSTARIGLNAFMELSFSIAGSIPDLHRFFRHTPILTEKAAYVHIRRQFLYIIFRTVCRM